MHVCGRSVILVREWDDCCYKDLDALSVCQSCGDCRVDGLKLIIVDCSCSLSRSGTVVGSKSCICVDGRSWRRSHFDDYF